MLVSGCPTTNHQSSVNVGVRSCPTKTCPLETTTGISSWKMKFHVHAKCALIFFRNRRQILNSGHLRLCGVCGDLCCSVLLFPPSFHTTTRFTPTEPNSPQQKQEKINLFVCAKLTSFTKVKTPSSPSNLTNCTVDELYPVFCGTT